MINNKTIYKKKWKLESFQYMQKSFTERYLSFLIKKVLAKHRSIYIYTIADVGCGIGLRTAILSKFFPNAKITGFDFSEEGINVARERYINTNMNFYVTDITKEDIGTFDLISAFEVLEHIDDWKSLVVSMAQKTNKYLLFSFPTGRMREHEKLSGHLRNFKKKEVETFLQELGFKPMTVLYAGFPFFSPIARELYRFFPSIIHDAHQQKMNIWIKQLHPIAYFIIRHFSTRKYFGDQFVGLFKKI